MTATPITASRDVLVLGGGRADHTVAAALQAAGITDFLVLDRDVVSSRFDDHTHSWDVRTDSGQRFQAHVVIAAHQSLLVPWLPEPPGRNDFRGEWFAAAQWDSDFDPAGKRVAVVGADSVAGHYLEQLNGSAAAVTVFAHAPRRLVAELPLPTTRLKHWLYRPFARRTRSGVPTQVGSAISAITESGVRTGDGVEHRADAIVYGTGFTVADSTPDAALAGAAGLTIRAACPAGTEPFLGVALLGFPNYFWITGPDPAGQARYVAHCLALMKATGSNRIEVRRSSQQVFNERAHLRPAQPFAVRSAFELSAQATRHDATYDGEATLTIAGACHPVRVRLSGHLDPIDGNYHWQGTVFSTPAQPLPDEMFKQTRTATLTVGERTAPARITEQTPWGTHSVAGVGAPPYALNGH